MNNNYESIYSSPCNAKSNISFVLIDNSRNVIIDRKLLAQNAVSQHTGCAKELNRDKRGTFAHIKTHFQHFSLFNHKIYRTQTQTCLEAIRHFHSCRGTLLFANPSWISTEFSHWFFKDLGELNPEQESSACERNELDLNSIDFLQFDMPQSTHCERIPGQQEIVKNQHRFVNLSLVSWKEMKQCKASFLFTSFSGTPVPYSHEREVKAIEVGRNFAMSKEVN